MIADYTIASIAPLLKNDRNEICISSNVCPFVSGKRYATKKTVQADITEKMKNEPAALQERKELKVMVITQEPSQLTRVTKLPAMPFIFIGNISDIMIQGIPPMPKEYVAI